MERMLAGMLPEALIVDVPELDIQHEEVFMRVEALKTACFEDDDAPLDEFESLVGFFAHHFRTEERIAAQAGLDFSRHAQIHRGCLKTLGKAFEEVREGMLDRHSFLRYVEFWFERHIQQEDKRFAESLLSRGRRRGTGTQATAHP